MITTNRRAFLVTIAAAAIASTFNPTANAQGASKGAVVIFPIVYSRNSGSSGSRETAVQSVGEVLQKAGYTLISNTVAENTWKRMRIVKPTTDRPSSMDEIVRFGKEMKAKYVVAPVFDFHSRSIWVDLGPKTISTATVDLMITSVRDRKVVYTRDGIQGRSDEKNSVLKDVGDVLLTPLVTIVSGGPKTPHEQRAVRIAVARALNGWVRPTK
ncbi:MAG: hypothetical protein ABJA67_13690 [Chthonomonadales bacterium]